MAVDGTIGKSLGNEFGNNEEGWEKSVEGQNNMAVDSTSGHSLGKKMEIMRQGGIEKLMNTKIVWLV